MAHPMLSVAAGVLVDAAGRVLLARRPRGKPLAGYWEFPGGKFEPGETASDALRRELREELAIEAGAIDPHPLIEVPWSHDGTRLRLIAHRVRAWQGTPRPCEGQALAWQPPSAVKLATLVPADHHILGAWRLPTHYLVTPNLPADTPAAVVHALLRVAAEHGEMLVQLRLPTWHSDAIRELAAACVPWLRDAAVSLLVNGDIEAARQLGIGVHLRAAQLAGLSVRPLPQGQWVGASCHSLAELQQAQAIGADFAVLSPVKATPTHPGAEPLGWAQLADLIAQTPMPVYALGGMTPADAERARVAGAQGVAGIRAFWPDAHHRANHL